MAVLKRLLPAIAAERPDIELIAAVNPKAGAFDGSSGVTSFAVDVDRSPAHLLWWYEFGLPNALRRHHADIVFSVTNYLPRRPLPCPTLLLVQHAGHFSPSFERLRNEASPSLLSDILWQKKSNWVRRSIARSTLLTVQTAALADAVAARTKESRAEIRVIPHGPGWVEQITSKRPRKAPNAPWRIGYVSKWGVQKNFGILFGAMRGLQQAGQSVTLVLTLDPSRVGASVLALAEEMGISSLIENHGEIPSDKLQGLYDSLDIFAFPSLCESFGVPMVEAMARGIPIVIADTPENREVTGGAALAFAPQNADDLQNQLERMIGNSEFCEAQSQLSLERGHSFSWARAAHETVQALDAAAALGPLAQ